MEALAAIGGLPQSFGRAGVDNFRVGWVHFQHMRAPRREGHALDLVEQIAGIFALVNSRAGADIHDLGIVLVNDDGEHIGIIDHAALDVLPGGPAISSLPGQVPGSGEDDVRILGINGD